MKSFYYARECDEKANEIIKMLKNKYPDLVVYQPVACESGQCRLENYKKDLDVKSYFSYSTKDAMNDYLENKNLFFKNIIKDYKKLLSEHSFVLVVTFKEFGKLSPFVINLELVKELNLNLVIEPECEELIKIAKNFGITPVVGECPAMAKEPNFMTPMAFESLLEEKAKSNLKTVVLPEGNDDRILKAADKLLKSGAVKLIILGNNKEIAQKASDLGIDLDDVKTYNPGNSSLDDECANALYEARKSKGMSLEQAKELIKDRNYFGTLLVHLGYADAMVSGAACSTADTIRPALQIVKTKPGVKSVSGGFFMCLSDKVWYFADCAVNPNPTPENLAEIASVSAATYKAFGFEPRVAMLSYSTANSGSGVSVDLVKQACELAKSYEGLNYDGPIQFDAAVDIATASKKMPDSKVAGKANVFVFPDLNAGNIAYKAVQRSAGAIAVGPVLQGLNKPINDLSRGCLVEDIVNTCLISAIQAQ
ncbi:phosphate acetyltransferase [Campylobacter sp. MG1]|uniref:phosphate acetyltransferase n=1 Tax=Campylobacter sp. MG1 TaxID=2976332 RepID=UPI00226D366B|nr:phosphate acetyltransferase [Campylobacter sp. MG1]